MSVSKMMLLSAFAVLPVQAVLLEAWPGKLTVRLRQNQRVDATDLEQTYLGRDYEGTYQVVEGTYQGREVAEFHRIEKLVPVLGDDGKIVMENKLDADGNVVYEAYSGNGDPYGDAYSGNGTMVPATQVKMEVVNVDEYVALTPDTVDELNTILGKRDCFVLLHSLDTAAERCDQAMKHAPQPDGPSGKLTDTAVQAAGFNPSPPNTHRASREALFRDPRDRTSWIYRMTTGMMRKFRALRESRGARSGRGPESA